MSFPRLDRALFRIACCSMFDFITFCDRKFSFNGGAEFVSCSLRGVRLRSCSLLIASEIMLETGVMLGSNWKESGISSRFTEGSGVVLFLLLLLLEVDKESCSFIEVG